jgi:hypothetical protein
MSTRYVLEQQIIDDIDRTDLSTQVSAAVDTAIRFHEHDRYWFNTVAKVTATLSSSTAFIPFTDLPYRFLEIDRMRVQRNTNYYWDLVARQRDWLFDRQDVIVYTEPSEYAVYAETIQFDNYAAQSYPLIMDGLVSLGNTASNSYSTSSSVAWFGAARDMIRAAAKKDLFLHVIKDPDQAVAMGVVETGVRNILKSKTNQLAATGRVQANDW